jgi:HEAT repeat protein
MSRATIVGRHVPAGGAATINGVLYQMLWTLLHASRATFVKPSVLENNQLQEVTLVLEPGGGGGDLVVKAKERRSVEQLKARSDGSKWSLKEIVEKVIPDLYLANLKDNSPANYRFVTEGRMGRWQKEYKFFRSILESPCPVDPLSDIDNTTPLKSAKDKKKNSTGSTTATPTSFWDRDSYTERELFLEVVSAVRKRRTVSENETELQTQKSLRSVLANFEFIGGQFMENVQKEIDSHLLAIVARNDDIPVIRDALAMELAKLATQGDVEVECREVFRKVGIDATPLTEWASIRRRSQVTTARYLQILGYEFLRDVRVATAKQLIDFWPEEFPILAITGESGSGKSWRAYAICNLAQHGESLCVIVSAGATLDETLNRAAVRIWQEIAGHDVAIPISQIAKRVRAVIGTKPNPWLTLVIDGITDRQHAGELIRLPWEDWGIRLVVTVSKRESGSLVHQAKDRCRLSTVENFNTRELHEYLAVFLGDNWPEMPEFMRSVLKVPLLADIYRQIVDASGNQQWIPQSEYELIANFWSRAHDLEPLDSDVLIRLAEKYLHDSAYPWRIRDVHEAGADNAAITRLEREGWFRTSPSLTGNTVELTHVRLLNWICSVALLSNRRNRKDDTAKLSATVRSFFDGSSQQHGYRLSFVPMDVLWLMCQTPQLRNDIPTVIASLEGEYARSKALYEHLLPTLGSTVVDALIVRLRASIDDWFVTSLITTGLGKIGGETVVRAALTLLDDENPFLQLSACDVFAKCPSAAPLDQLWQVHNACQSTPERFLRDREKHNAHILRNRTFPALQECCRVSPDWLTYAIERSDPNKECIADLAYLLSGIRQRQGGELWNRVKPVLFQKIAPEHHRALAVCVDIFSDKNEVSWLIETLNKEHFIGVSAAKAVARFQPLEAIQHLHKIPLREIVCFRTGIFDLLFAAEPEATRRRLIELMDMCDNLWDVATLYDGRCHQMDVATLDVLLADLTQQLAILLSRPDWGDSEPLGRELNLLAQIQTNHLVQHLRRQCGTSLESRLTEFVLRIGIRSWDDTFVLRSALAVLFRIGGDGFTRVVNEMLRAGSWYVRLEAILLADRRPDQETFNRLAEITSDLEMRDDSYLEQSRAAVILASHGRWEYILGFVQAVGTQSLVRTLDFPAIAELPRLGFRPPSTLLKELSEQVASDPTGVSAGQVIAMGFGPPEFGAFVRNVATSCDPESDLALACGVALDMMQDKNAESVDFLKAQLRIKQHNFIATNALIMNGTQTALDAMEEFAGVDVSGAVAINLVRHSTEKQRAIEKVCSTVVRAVSGRRSWDYVTELHRLVKRIKDSVVAKAILSQPTVAEYLAAEAFADEGNIWLTGSKYCAIKCLEYIDPASALVAAKAALRNPSGRDRDFYPPVVAELDPEHAPKFLIDLLAIETSELVRKSIGRTIHSLDAEAEILSAMKSADEMAQLAGCFAAGWFRPSAAISEQLIAKVGSSSAAISNAAVAAVTQLLLRSECYLLGQEVLQTNDAFERWLYLSCLLELADCGDDHHLWPVGGPVIGDAITSFQISFANKQLEKRRAKEKERPLV